MLQQATLKFLHDLGKNNNKNWFEDHRGQYETAKTDFTGLVTDVIKGIVTFDQAIAGQEAKNCLFRINRDVRFSKNKSPYKNNMSAYFNKAGKKGLGAGYYLHIQPGKSMIAGGIWMPEPAVLGKIRQEIDYNLKEWEKMLHGGNFKKNFPSGLEAGERLIRPPKGYDIDNPAIEYLKMKNFVVTKPFSDKEILSSGFKKEVVGSLKAMKPMIDFLNRSID